MPFSLQHAHNWTSPDFKHHVGTMFTTKHKQILKVCHGAFQQHIDLNSWKFDEICDMSLLHIFFLFFVCTCHIIFSVNLGFYCVLSQLTCDKHITESLLEIANVLAVRHEVPLALPPLLSACYQKSCHSCEMVKPELGKGKSPLHQEIFGARDECVAFDIVGKLLQTPSFNMYNLLATATVSIK